MTYGLDFRRKVLSVRQKEDLTIGEVASRFNVGIASVVRWLKEVHPKASGSRDRKIDLSALSADVRDNPDAYQHERAARFGVATSSMNVALKKLGVRYKKNAGAPSSKRRKTAYLPETDF